MLCRVSLQHNFFLIKKIVFSNNQKLISSLFNSIFDHVVINVTSIHQVLLDKHNITSNITRRDEKLCYYSKHSRSVTTREHARILLDKSR